VGVKQTPDFAQHIMEDALPDIHEQKPHIDDVGVFGKRNGAFSEHLTVPDCVLK